MQLCAGYLAMGEHTHFRICNCGGINLRTRFGTRCPFRLHIERSYWRLLPTDISCKFTRLLRNGKAFPTVVDGFGVRRLYSFDLGAEHHGSWIRLLYEALDWMPKINNASLLMLVHQRLPLHNQTLMLHLVPMGKEGAVLFPSCVDLLARQDIEKVAALVHDGLGVARQGRAPRIALPIDLFYNVHGRYPQHIFITFIFKT